ncbi:MAG: hypothetical protein KQH63_18465 [Desulfobulbaceae bacterium]|nr:hypothetical protein [Desulfobulbaceae bacterium]
MKKITMIASCLVNSSMISRMEDAENAVRQAFSNDFPNDNFDTWNQELPDDIANKVIKNVGRASKINVTRFIQDFWE